MWVVDVPRARMMEKRCYLDLSPRAPACSCNTAAVFFVFFCSKQKKLANNLMHSLSKTSCELLLPMKLVLHFRIFSPTFRPAFALTSTLESRIDAPLHPTTAQTRRPSPVARRVHHPPTPRTAHLAHPPQTLEPPVRLILRLHNLSLPLTRFRLRLFAHLGARSVHDHVKWRCGFMFCTPTHFFGRSGLVGSG